MVRAIRKRKRILAMASIVLAMAIVSCACGFVVVPLRTGDVVDSPAVRRSDPSHQRQQEAEPLGAYGVIFQKNLRGPLFDPKPPPVVSRPAEEPKSNLHLAGVVLEKAFAYAIIMGKSGTSKLVQVGETIDRAEVVDITADSATVMLDGKRMTLKLKKSKMIQKVQKNIKKTDQRKQRREWMQRNPYVELKRRDL